MNNREASGEFEHEDTLPGLGPQLGAAYLTRSDEASSSEMDDGESVMVMDVMRAQDARYQWFLERVQTLRSVDELAAILWQPPTGPGMWEAALVELSVSSERLARALLQRWQPPAEDPTLGLFYQICVSRARRSA